MGSAQLSSLWMGACRHCMQASHLQLRRYLHLDGIYVTVVRL